MGAVLAAFNLGYFLCQVPGGIVASRFGVRGAMALMRWQNRKGIKLQKAVNKTTEVLGQVMVDIDPILKKISQSGMHSLTKDEKEKLAKASEIKRLQKSKVISLDEYRNKRE